MKLKQMSLESCEKLNDKRKIQLCTEPTKAEKHRRYFRTMFKNKAQQNLIWLNQESVHKYITF